MQRISISVSIFVLVFLGLSANTNAQEQNTYRAAQPYMKIAALNDVQCEQQCRGDARCGGWNFVPPNRHDRVGVCEFNARKTLGVASQNYQVYRGSDHARLGQRVSAQGRTIRVGTPIVPRPVLNTAPKFKYGLETPKGEQVYTRLQTSPPPHTIASANKDLQSSSQNQRRQYYRQQMLAAQRRGAEQAYARNFGISPPRQTFIPLAQRGTTRFDQRPKHLQANVPQNPLPQNSYPQNPAPIQQAPIQQAPVQQSSVQQSPEPEVKPQAFVPQTPSLYGSLHDDLIDLTQNMTPVRRPQTAPDRVNNPDAPLSTSRPVPSKRVEITQLESPDMSQMAGGL